MFKSEFIEQFFNLLTHLPKRKKKCRANLSKLRNIKLKIKIDIKINLTLLFSK